VVIAAATLMVVLDTSIINLTLPQAQAALGMSDATHGWVVTAYTLTFGALLLLGGRVTDLLGRRRIFLDGLIGFAATSALGGLAPTAGMLFAARALQGVFAALLAPAALSLISTTFVEDRERAKAFAVYGAVAGGGGAVGLILGVCSPSTPAGGGACSSTCPSRWPQRWPRCARSPQWSRARPAPLRRARRPHRHRGLARPGLRPSPAPGKAADGSAWARSCCSPWRW
jgi:MFS family permease